MPIHINTTFLLEINMHFHFIYIKEHRNQWNHWGFSLKISNLLVQLYMHLFLPVQKFTKIEMLKTLLYIDI